ncbi:hypothetical protein AB5J56_17005 [Streptomyces sp. R21]|uniref:Uncharacterized protein n=1 Tax=Streptomyces sp. R21 TaxID=3238627 RepID=A0AB39P760_9ACTN
MKRSLHFAVLLGMLCALVPVGSAAAAGDTACPGDFAARLDCWSGLIHEGTVEITLNDTVPFDSRHVDKGVAQKLYDNRGKLVVRVPKGKETGEGGTALLVLATGRLVDGGAQITRLHAPALDWLKQLRICDRKPDKPLCDQVADAPPKTRPLSGDELISQNHVANLATHLYVVSSGVPQDPQPSDTSANKGGATTGGNDGGKSKGGESNGINTTTWVIAGMSAVLLALLAAFVTAVRRSSHSSRAPAARSARPVRAAALAAPGVGALPAARARGADAPGADPRAADESTTRLLVAPAPRYGRQVGARTGPARTATVRTALHPQGYVELDRILYRAVWAEPGRPPPAPGSLVDVTDARERDSDVLYAFPPAAGRHAKGTR